MSSSLPTLKLHSQQCCFACRYRPSISRACFWEPSDHPAGTTLRRRHKQKERGFITPYINPPFSPSLQNLHLFEHSATYPLINLPSKISRRDSNMKLSTVTLPFFIAYAAASPLAETALTEAPVQERSLMTRAVAPTPCQVGAQYCGWALADGGLSMWCILLAISSFIFTLASIIQCTPHTVPYS
jgi:hypothetical protein